jgi:hypothetical protein
MAVGTGELVAAWQGQGGVSLCLDEGCDEVVDSGRVRPGNMSHSALTPANWGKTWNLGTAARHQRARTKYRPLSRGTPTPEFHSACSDAQNLVRSSMVASL